MKSGKSKGILSFFYTAHFNNIISATFLLICFFPSLLFSQWIVQNSSIRNNTKHIIANSFINQNTGWLASDKGGIIKTTDGGISWQDFTIDTNIRLVSLCFLNESTGFSCGFTGKIYKTINGGINWQISYSKESDSLYCIDFADNNTGWCTGFRRILKTTNSGLIWVNLPIDTINSTAKYTCIKFFDSQNGILGGFSSGDNAPIYKTTNGGTNWQYIHSFSGTEILSVDFVNKDTVYATSSGIFLISTNGGFNWSQQYFSGSSDSSYVMFKDLNTGILTSDQYTYITTNAGIDWTNLFLLHPDYSSRPFYDKSGTCFIIGDRGTILKSTDNGVNFGNYSTDVASELYDVKLLDENTGIICGNYGTILKTTNGGINWNRKSINSYGYFYQLSFINQITGWIMDVNSNIIKTTDGGDSWNLLNFGFQNRQWKYFEFFNENTGWYAADLGIVLKTTNGGLSWINKCPDTNDRYIYVKNLNGNNLILCSFDKVYMSTNGGSNWNIVLQDTLNLEFRNISFLDENTGWIIVLNNDSRRIYKTTNGGNNWTKGYIMSHNSPFTNSIKFVNEYTGFTSPIDGYAILKTTDGGYNWFQTFASEFSEYIHAVDFINQDTGLAVGSFGLICKTTNGGANFISLPNSIPPVNFFLFQNYPNPFNLTTNIGYSLLVTGQVQLKVFDILGREIETLVNAYQNAGSYVIQFYNNRLSSGIYFYRLSSGNYFVTKKMVLIK